MSQYTVGEIKALIAPLLELEPHEIEEFVLVAKGTCTNCGGHGAIYTRSSADNDSDDLELLSETVRMFAEGHD